MTRNKQYSYRHDANDKRKKTKFINERSVRLNSRMINFWWRQNYL